jgi:hypothetical protein
VAYSGGSGVKPPVHPPQGGTRRAWSTARFANKKRRGDRLSDRAMRCALFATQRRWRGRNISKHMHGARDSQSPLAYHRTTRPCRCGGGGPAINPYGGWSWRSMPRAAPLAPLGVDSSPGAGSKYFKPHAWRARFTVATCLPLHHVSLSLRWRRSCHKSIWRVAVAVDAPGGPIGASRGSVDSNPPARGLNISKHMNGARDSHGRRVPTIAPHVITVAVAAVPP